MIKYTSGFTVCQLDPTPAFRKKKLLTGEQDRTVLIFQTPGKAGVSFLLERGSLWEYLDLFLFKGLN